MKNLAPSVQLMTYLHEVAVSTVVLVAVSRPQAAEFFLLPLCLGFREGQGCAVSLPTGFNQLGFDTRHINIPCSETESGECSEGEMSDLTPCNASPSLSQLLSWTGCRSSVNTQ